jgi:hypothetical protein
MGSIRVDDSRFPLVVTTFDGPVSDAEFEDYLQATTKKTLARQTRNVVIVDASGATRPPASQRKRQAEWLNENQALLKQYNLGTVFVISSALIRGGLTAIFWLAPMPSPTTVLATYSQAVAWAFERLRAAGIQPPAAVPMRAPGAR